METKWKMAHKIKRENYQSQVSILGPVGYGPTTLPLRHSDLMCKHHKKYILFSLPVSNASLSGSQPKVADNHISGTQ